MTLRKIALRKFVPTTSLTLAIAMFAAGSLTAPAIAISMTKHAPSNTPWRVRTKLRPTVSLNDAMK